MPSTDELTTKFKKRAEDLEALFTWLAQTISSEPWVKKLTVVLAGALLLLNPVSVEWVLTSLLIGGSLPHWYSLAFGSLSGAIFLLTLIVAVHTERKKRRQERPLPKPRTAIKCLTPFGREDAEIFSRLQRERMVTECLTCLSDPDFTFGVLFGESGCGKTSFIQAGVWPRLEQEKGHRCLYVKFSGMDPIKSIRQAAIDQFSLPKEVIAQKDLMEILEHLASAGAKPIVLLFDQFEQFFTRHRAVQEREPFITALATWYGRIPRLPVKILVVLRSDFLDRLDDLQKAMQYSLGPQEIFRLKKFHPLEATAVFHILLETEGIPFDPDFASQVMHEELASREDGLVSPVDLQVLAWMIAGQAIVEERAFNRVAYQKLGGVEGLLERFLERALQARLTEGRRQAALKVLLALIDLDRNVRAGLLTIEDIKKKLQDTLASAEVEEATAWLVTPGVRLVTSDKKDGALGYELAHERLIPAVRRLAGKQLSEADRVNQLLDRRVNEWLGNNRAKRYLFSWRELRKVKRQTPYLTFGPHKDQKEELLAQSRRRLRRRSVSAVITLLVVTSFPGWLITPWGVIWQAKYALVDFCRQYCNDPFTISEIMEVLAANQFFGEANEIALEIRYPDPRGFAQITQINGAVARSKLGDPQLATVLLKQAQQTAEEINDNLWRGYAFAKVAEAAITLGDLPHAVALLTQARQIAERNVDPFMRGRALAHVAEAAAKLGDRQLAVAVLLQVRQAAEQIPDPSARGLALRGVANGTGKLALMTKDLALLTQARQIIEQIPDPSTRGAALIDVAKSAAELGDMQHAAALLTQARQAVEQIPTSSTRAMGLVAVAKAAARLGDRQLAVAVLLQVRQAAEQIPDPSNRDYTLVGIAVADSRLGDPQQAAVFLTQARRTADQIPESYVRAWALNLVTDGAGRLALRTRDLADLAHARQVAEQIQELNARSAALRTVAEDAARLKQWRLARTLVWEMDISNDKEKALVAILKAWAEARGIAPSGQKIESEESGSGMSIDWHEY